MPISHTLHTESTLRIYWFSHHTFLSHTDNHTTKKSIRRLSTMINLLKFVVLSSLRCLVPVRFRIIVTISSHYNTYRLQVQGTGVLFACFFPHHSHHCGSTRRSSQLGFTGIPTIHFRLTRPHTALPHIIYSR